MYLMKGLWAALLLSAAVASASAQPAPMKSLMPPKASAQHPCAGDIVHFCSAVPSGMGRKWACLRKHRSQLQPICFKLLGYIDSVEARLAGAYHESVEQFRAEAYANYNAGGQIRVNPPALAPSSQH